MNTFRTQRIIVTLPVGPSHSERIDDGVATFTGDGWALTIMSTPRGTVMPPAERPNLLKFFVEGAINLEAKSATGFLDPRVIWDTEHWESPSAVANGIDKTKTWEILLRVITHVDGDNIYWYHAARLAWQRRDPLEVTKFGKALVETFRVL